MVFRWSVSDSKSPQVSRTLLSILVDLNNAVVWMVLTRPLISKSSSPFNNPLVTVPRAPITTGINATFMFHVFFNSRARSRYLSLFSLLILLYSQLEQQSPQFCKFSFFLLIIIYSFRVFHISVNWWFFTGVWVTASLLRSPGLVSGFWLFLAMLSFG